MANNAETIKSKVAGFTETTKRGMAGRTETTLHAAGHTETAGLGLIPNSPSAEGRSHDS